MAIIGVDTGGTFTDFVLLDNGTVRVYKVPSTPDDPSAAILKGIADLVSNGDLSAVVHGSTVATNAVLERKGARTGLVTTAGFRDVLEIGRQTRPSLYNLNVQKEPPLVPREHRLEVTERLSELGEVLTPLDHGSIDAVITALREAEIESVAVCLLFSFVNPGHEQAVCQAIRDAGFTVSASCDVLPEFREYERTSTTVLNAYVMPLMDRYLGHLEEQLPAGVPLRIMQSNGGAISAATARSEAARTLLSGPAAGVVGAMFAASASGISDCIALDMGGTSTDVSLIHGAITETTEGMVGGYPSRVPMIDIHTVGAGGGSIGWFDAGGALRVGPRSAGADPGPAAYGRGGTEPTVTDANLVLGRLGAGALLGGDVTMDVAGAVAAIEPIAERLESSVEEAALGIISIANANMEAAVRVISVEKGHDPRAFTLVPFGGAGPLHACELAESLRIPQVLFPATPGVLSALGMLAADIVKDYVRTILATGGVTEEEVRSALAELAEQGRQEILDEGIPWGAVSIERYVDLRYAGQSYELRVPFNDDLDETINAFHEMHRTRFGYSDPGEPVQIVNVRVKARGIVDPPVMDEHDLVDAPLPEPAEHRPVIFATPSGAARLETPVYQRDTLHHGAAVPGPAIISQYDTTIVLPPGWQGTVDRVGNLIATQVEG